MKLKITLVLLLIILHSCASMFSQKLLLGVRNPKVQSEKKISKFIAKHAESDQRYYFKREYFLAKIEQSSSYFAEWELYNKDGFRVISLDSNVRNCNGYTQSFLKNFPNSPHAIDSTSNIFQNTLITNGIINYFETPVNPLLRDTSIYFIVLYFATFMGKYASDVLHLEQFATDNRLVSIQPIRINMDFREEYGITNDDLQVGMKVRKK